MDVLFGLVGFLGVIICLIILLIRIIRKRPKKPILIVLGISFVFFVIGLNIESNETQEVVNQEQEIDETKQETDETKQETDETKQETDETKQEIDETKQEIIDDITVEEQEIVEDEKNNLEMKVHFIDVGQADSIFIDYGDYDILIDAGNNDDGDLVVNYLKSLNTDDLEIVIATHPHEDHIGGLDDVLNAFEVETIIDSGYVASTKTYKDYYYAATHEENAKFMEDDNMIFDLGNGVKFEVIESGDSFGNSTNDYSVITKLDYNNVSFLFTGDMEEDAESNIIDENIQADVLKVGHHGSNTSTTLEFLEKVNPSYAIISCGKDNKYGHPKAETLNKLKDRNIQTFRTDKQGTIIATTDGNNITFNTKPTEIVIEKSEEIIDSITEPSDDSDSNSNLIQNGGVIIEKIILNQDTVYIKNTSTDNVNLKGWKILSVKGNQEYIFPEYVLKAGETVKVYAKSGAGDLKWADGYIWNNGGDPGQLIDINGNIVSKYPR